MIRFDGLRANLYVTLGLLAVGLLLIDLGQATGQTSRRQSPPTGGQTKLPAPQQNIQVLAIVNGQQITREQLAQESIRRFGEPVIESLINNMLIGQRCQAEGIRVTEQDVDAEIERRAKKFGMSSERYIDLIREERDVSIEKLRNEIVWTELALRRLAASHIQVSDEEIQSQLASEFGAKVQVRAIALDDRAKADKILAHAKANPQQFSRLAIDHSVDANSASVGGLLPPLRRNMGEPTLEEAAFSLNVGDISEVIPISEQFIILKCERHYPPVQLAAEQQVLAKQRIEDEIREAKLGDAATALFQEMQETAQIVNVYNDPELRKRLPGVAATVGSRQIMMEHVYEECITRFGRDVLQSEINRVVILQELQRKGLQVTDDDLRREIGRAAESFGIVKQDGTADINRWMAQVSQNDPSKTEIYVQDEVWPTVAMKKIVAPTVQVTDEDMQKGFEANFGPRVNVLAIVLQDQRTAQKVWEMARANSTEQYFGELAHQYSVEPASRANYGEVPPIQMHGGRPMLEEEAFRLKPGQISGLVSVGENWVILWCKGRTTPVVQEFDAVKDELYKDIMEKKLRIAMAEEFERLQSAAQIDNFLIGSSQPGAGAQPGAEGRRSPAADPAGRHR